MSPRGAAPQNEMDDQVTATYQIDRSANTWKLISAILGMILIGGTIISTMGKAFYVTRTEYTEKSQKDAVDQVYLQQTLVQLKKSLDDQQTAFATLSTTVQGLKLVVAKHYP